LHKNITLALDGVKMKKPEVYLDMDGVLADFFSEYAKLAGIESGNYRDVPPAKNDPTLNKMVGTNFFERLPKFNTTDQLVAMIVKMFGHYHICSSPLRGDHENCEKCKRNWIKENLNPQPVDIVITPNKAKWAKQADGTPNILIDDRGSNITAWEAAGGIGIKYQADEDGLEKVVEGLARATRILKGDEDQNPQKLDSKDRGKPTSAADVTAENDEIRDPHQLNPIMAKESIFKTKEDERLYLWNLNSQVSIDTWCSLIEQHLIIGQSFLKESIDEKVLQQSQQLINFSDNTPKLKKEYIPITIMIVGSTVHVYDVYGQTPPTENAKFCQLINIKNNSFTFLVDGQKITLPNERLSVVSFMKTILIDNYSDYNKFRTVLKLSFDKDLPSLQSNVEESASVGAISAGGIASVPSGGAGAKVGSLFGGNFKQPKRKKTKVLRR